MSERQDQERIEEEAAEWLAALDCGRADRAAFEAWRAADPAHAIAFIRINQSWRQLDRLAHARGVSRADESVVGEDLPPRPARRRLLRAAGLGAVAATAGAVIAIQRAAAHDVETAIGERKRFYVDEAACLDLNTSSRLRWWRGDEGIEIRLDRGQLHIDLAVGAPGCALHAGPATIRFGAGAFDVRLLSSGQADIVAINGSAELVARRGAAGPLWLKPRQGVSVSEAGKASLRPVAEDAIRARAAWLEGELIFDGQTLAEAVDEYNRYLRTPIVLADPDAARLRLGGRFLTNNPAEFLDAVRLNFGLRAERHGNQIRLHR